MYFFAAVFICLKISLYICSGLISLVQNCRCKMRFCVTSAEATYAKQNMAESNTDDKALKVHIMDKEEAVKHLSPTMEITP